MSFPELEPYLNRASDDENFKSEGPFMDINLGFIRQNEKIMSPSDDSLMKTQKVEIGNKRVGRAIALKDNLTMGIREPFKRRHEGEDLLEDV